MKVKNLINGNGNPSANQFVIRVGYDVYFHSYNTTIAKFSNGVLTINRNWNVSKTTSKHLYLFIRQYTPFYIDNKKELKKCLKDNNRIRYGEVMQFEVENILNDNCNRSRNQFIIKDGDNVYFQSYDSPIARFNKVTRDLTLSDYWDYSATTRKHLYIFLRPYLGYVLGNDIKNLIKKESIKVISRDSI